MQGTGAVGRMGTVGWVGAAVRPAPGTLMRLETTLTGIIAAIHQTTDRRARIVVATVTGKIGGAIAAGGIAGLVAAWGTASTGTAIAGLSGAAASTATLYWLGSAIGLGVAGGGLILGAAAVGGGVAASRWAQARLVGRPRAPADLQTHERAIVAACATLVAAVRDARARGAEPTAAELRLVATRFLAPLAQQIAGHWDAAALARQGIAGPRPFAETLALLPRARLARRRAALARMIAAVGR